MPQDFHPSFGDLPEEIAVFPLPGALLLPWGRLPLNIFEPRYLVMIDAALAGNRLIGIIQPDPSVAAITGPTALYEIGCAGRITQYAETGDGRLLIQLTGIARFKLVDDNLQVPTPFRQGEVDFRPFEADLEPRRGEALVDREAILAALRAFSEANQVEIDWKNVGDAANEALVNALSMMAPFGPREKQALLEAVDLKTRAEMLVALTEIDLARDGNDGGPRMQ